MLDQQTQQIAKAIQNVQDQAIAVRTGTALSGTDRVSGVITVQLDNDPAGTPVSAVSVGGLIQLGARVMMLAYPPRGLVVIGQIGGTPNLQVMSSVSYANQASYTSNVPTLGASNVGFTFVAPLSGSVLLEVAPSIDVLGLGARGRVFARVYTGSAVGVGITPPVGATLIWEGDGDQGPLVVGQNQVGAAAARYIMGSGQCPVTGLTPNQTYSASLWYRLEFTGAGLAVNVNSRRLTGLLVA